MEKYKCLLNGKVVTVIKREGDNVTYICDGFVHHAHIDWFMENCKKL